MFHQQLFFKPSWWFHALLVISMFWGCKRTPETVSLQSPVQVAEAWYKQQAENLRQNPPSVARPSTGKANREGESFSWPLLDSLPFHPVWQEATSHQLSDGTSLIVAPVWRYAGIQYFHTGFVRRLVLHLDANHQVLEGKIIEFIGEMEYLAKHKAQLALALYENRLPDYIFSRKFPVNSVVASRMYLISSGKTDNKNPGRALRNAGPSNPCVGSERGGIALEAVIEISGVCVLTTICFDGTLVSSFTPCPPQGSGGDSGGGSGSGGSGDTPIYTPILPPPGGGGGSGNPPGDPPPSDEQDPETPDPNPPTDDGDHTEPTPIGIISNNPNPPDASPELNAIVDWNNSEYYFKNNATLVKNLSATLKNIMDAHPAYKKLHSELVRNNIKIRLKIGDNVLASNQKGLTVIDEDNQVTIFFTAEGVNNSAVVVEELFHTYQTKKIYSFVGVIPANALPHMEFEAKLFIQMVFQENNNKKLNKPKEYRFQEEGRIDQIEAANEYTKRILKDEHEFYQSYARQLYKRRANLSTMDKDKYRAYLIKFYERLKASKTYVFPEYPSNNISLYRPQAIIELFKP